MKRKLKHIFKLRKKHTLEKNVIYIRAKKEINIVTKGESGIPTEKLIKKYTDRVRKE